MGAQVVLERRLERKWPSGQFFLERGTLPGQLGFKELPKYLQTFFASDADWSEKELALISASDMLSYQDFQKYLRQFPSNYQFRKCVEPLREFSACKQDRYSIENFCKFGEKVVAKPFNITALNLACMIGTVAHLRSSAKPTARSSQLVDELLRFKNQALEDESKFWKTKVSKVVWLERLRDARPKN